MSLAPTTGTATDVDGRYTLTVPDNATLGGRVNKFVIKCGFVK